MIDGIIAGTGTSRSLYGSLPSTYAEFKAAVEAGTQYVDVGYHADGWQQEPTFLNKANLLTDAVAALFGLTPNDTVNDAFNAASSLISTAQTTANGRAKIASGSYTGTGTYGSSNQNSLSFSFAPKLVIIRYCDTVPLPSFRDAVFSQTGPTLSTSGGFNGTVTLSNATAVVLCKGLLNGASMSWYNSDSADKQMNASGETYYYLAFG